MKLQNVDIEILPGGEVMFQRSVMGDYCPRRHVVTRKLCAESVTELRSVATLLMEGKEHG